MKNMTDHVITPGYISVENVSHGTTALCDASAFMLDMTLGMHYETHFSSEVQLH